MEFNKKLSGVVNKVPSDQAIKLGENLEIPIGGEVDLTPIQAELEKQQLLITNQAIAINKDREEMDLIKAENESLKSELVNTARAINTLTGAEVAE